MYVRRAGRGKIHFVLERKAIGFEGKTETGTWICREFFGGDGGGGRKALARDGDPGI